MCLISAGGAVGKSWEHSEDELSQIDVKSAGKPEVKELSPSSVCSLLPEYGYSVSSLHPGPLTTFSLPTAMSSLNS